MIHRLPLGHEPPTPSGHDQVDETEVAALIAAEARPAPDGRPWVAVNMVTSLDGGTATAAGVSGDLGGDADSLVFGALRSVADVILAGSATVTAERYRPPRTDPDRATARRARGQATAPRIAVVSNAGDIDLDLPLFADAEQGDRPVVLVATDRIDEARRARLAEVAEVLDAGDESVDPARAIEVLAAATGAQVVLCEGGPTLNGLLLAADLVDEWCLTLGPLLVGGTSDRAAHGPGADPPSAFTLQRLWRHGDELLLRYVRRR